jgi:hypothetical protein
VCHNIIDGITIKRIAANFVMFVDDIRGAGGLLEIAWQVLCQVAAIFNYLGIQDAPWK